MACYGRYLPQLNQMLRRVVCGRPVRAVTCLFRAWLTTSLAAQGKRARVLLWDHASGQVSREERQWIRAHHRTVKYGGGCRLLIWRLPRTSPWLNSIEPKWVHGKRAVSEPVRTLTAAELRQRVCAYYPRRLLKVH
jgi:DDE superfamily endonuclease